MKNRQADTASSRHVAQRGASVALAAILALAGQDACALRAFAQESEDVEAASVVEAEQSPSASESEEEIALASENATSLNDAWRSQSGSTSAVFTITEGGTYYLEDDLTVEAMLSVNAAGSDVTIDLRGHTLTFRTPNAAATINAISASSVTITGNSQNAGGSPSAAGTIRHSGGAIRCVIKSSADALCLDGFSVEAKPALAYATSMNAPSYGIDVVKGSLSMTNCSVLLDHSGSDTTITPTVPLECIAGVRIETTADQAHIANCSLDVIGSPQTSFPDETSVAGQGWVYGVYASSSKLLVIENSSVSATSPRGGAVALFAKNMTASSKNSEDITEHAASAREEEEGADDKEVATDTSSTEGLSLNANAASIAAGIRPANSSDSRITLACPLAMSYDGDADPQRKAALYSTKEGAFALGEDFLGSGLDVLIELDDGAGNEAGTRIASFEPSVSPSQRTSIARSFENALGAQGACSVAYDEEGVFFEINDENAPVELVSSSGATSAYSSVEQACAAANAGDTIRLRESVDAVSVPADLSATSLTIDLNGYDISTLAVACAGELTVTSSVAGEGSISGFDPNTKACITLSSSGALRLEGISVSCNATASEASAIAVTSSGALALENASVSCTSTRTAAYGINLSGGAGGTVRASSSSVSAQTAAWAATATAVKAASSASSISLLDCVISARTVTGNAMGIDTAGTLAAQGSHADSMSVNVTTDGIASRAWGIRATGDGTCAALDTCAITVATSSHEDISEKSYWCLMSGSDTALGAITWKLDGTCDFESVNDTAIAHARPLVLGASFKAARTISLKSDKLGGDAVATSEAGQAAALASARAFAPAASSAYDGWSLASDSSGTTLIWNRAATVINTSTGDSFTSLAEAVAHAAEGDTLKLSKTSSESTTIRIDKALTIDLAGHALAIEAQGLTAQSGSSSAALVFEGEGTLRIIDSSASGSGELDIYVGNTAESASTITYQGILASAGSVVIDDAQVCVSYAGATSATGTSMPQVTLRGAVASGGTVTLENGATLAAEAISKQAGAKAASSHANAQAGTTESSSGGQDAFGANIVEALYVATPAASGSGQPSILVDGSSSVEAVNDSSALARGSNTITSGSNTSASTTTNYLRQVHIDPESSLYEEVQQKFRAQAKLDSSADANGEVYDTQIYYATAMKLDDGTYLWAYSDPVDASDVGKMDSITATTFFTASAYSLVPQTRGISCSVASSASVVVSGSVQATCENGSASALRTSGSGTWLLVGARLSAQAASTSYLALSGTLDLRDHLSFTSDPGVLVKYPKAGTDYLVTRTPTSASGIEVTSDNAAVLGAESCTQSTGGGGAEVDSEIWATPPAEETASTVKVTFANMHAQDGSLAPHVSATLSCGATLAEANASIPQPEDFAEGDVTYRFVGWSILGAADNLIYDPAELSSMAVGTDTAGSSGNGEATITFVATYVPVQASQHLVVFKVDNTLAACGVNDGSAPSYASCLGASSSGTPTKIVTESSSAYSFAGWAEGWSRDPIASTTSALSATVPVASGDATYTAQFTVSEKTLSVNFSLWTSGNAGAGYGVTTLKAAYGTDPRTTADTLVREGDVLTAGGITYEFLGWSPRISDVEPLYTGAMPALITDKTSYYGIYASSEKTVTVKFYVGDALYAQADDVKATSTISAALALAGNPDDPASHDDELTFRGWATSTDAASGLREVYVTVADAMEQSSSASDDELVLFAVFSEPPDVNDGGKDDDAPDGSTDTPGDASGSPSSGSDGTSGTSSNTPDSPQGGATLDPGSSGGATLSNSETASGPIASTQDGADGSDGENGEGSPSRSSDAAASASTTSAGPAGATSPTADQTAGGTSASEAQLSESSTDAAGFWAVLVVAVVALATFARNLLRRRDRFAFDEDADEPHDDKAPGREASAAASADGSSDNGGSTAETVGSAGVTTEAARPSAAWATANGARAAVTSGNASDDEERIHF